MLLEDWGKHSLEAREKFFLPRWESTQRCPPTKCHVTDEQAVDHLPELYVLMSLVATGTVRERHFSF